MTSMIDADLSHSWHRYHNEQGAARLADLPDLPQSSRSSIGSASPSSVEVETAVEAVPDKTDAELEAIRVSGAGRTVLVIDDDPEARDIAERFLRKDGFEVAGVYRITDEGPVFQPVRAPTAEQLHTLLNQIIKRIMKFRPPDLEK